jgi:O-antigen biosynthesis protein
MPALRLSVIVVSWARPRALVRCLIALSQMRSSRFEVIVVADDDGRAALSMLPFADRISVIYQIVENISLARNLGIAAASGDVVAFIDDDAVPEPDWAETILAAFADDDLAAATGPVIGRNGISLQWGRMASDRLGRDRALDGTDASGPSETVKLHGTNMAFRRRNLALIGGFDPIFRFYLDETDLAMRMTGIGAKLAYLPAMRVHHGYLASPRRRADRVPTDLTEIGASTAVYLRKHAPESLDMALESLVEHQRLRLLRFARGRKIGPADMRDLLLTLRKGIAEGRSRNLSAPIPIPVTTGKFHPLRKDIPPPMAIRDGWWHQGASLRATAAADVAMGQPVALILMEPSPRKHKIIFTDGGWWEQSGGLFGPRNRTETRLQFWRYSARVARERDRLFHPDG